MDRVDVRFAPNATELLRGSEMTRWAMSGLMHRNKNIGAAPAASNVVALANR